MSDLTTLYIMPWTTNVATGTSLVHALPPSHLLFVLNRPETKPHCSENRHCGTGLLSLGQDGTFVFRRQQEFRDSIGRGEE